MGTAGNTRVLQRVNKLALIEPLVEEVDFSQVADTIICFKLTLVLILRILVGGGGGR